MLAFLPHILPLSAIVQTGKLMRAHYLQHIHFEGLGSIEQWLSSTGYDVTSTQMYHSSQFPPVDDIDLLIIMGGPMSVNDEKNYPWLSKEKEFIKSTIAAGKPTLGICLGAQLIASAMGGTVFPNPQKEIGWFPVSAVSPVSRDTFKFPVEIQVFHWHGETFAIPPGARLLATNKTCTNQAFQIGNNVIGLQFHLETTPASAKALVQHCRGELAKDKYIQEESVILSAPQEYYTSINNLMNDILVYLHHK